jgi:hypothetical protein
MEFAIPISRFDPANVKWGSPHVGPFRKIIPFEYQDNQLYFSTLTLALEPMKVVGIDWDRNQIVLEESDSISFLSKLENFQRLININIAGNYKSWFHEGELPDFSLLSPLQPWLKNRRITLYLSSDPKSLSFYAESVKATFSEKTVKPGDLIRANVKLHGISLQVSHEGTWTGKSRIQHNILDLYKVTVNHD